MNHDGMLPLHSCIECFKKRRFIDYASLLDRLRLLLPGHPEAIDVVPHFYGVEVGFDWYFWWNAEEHGLYKEVAGLLLEEISLRDQLEWARQVVEVLSLTSSTIGTETACLWATEWRDACRDQLHAIEVRLAALENLLEEFRGNESDDG